MKTIINSLLFAICILTISQSVIAAELDTTKIYKCSGIIDGKEESVLYDARIVPERDCQRAAELGAIFSGKTVNSEDIKKSCISGYNNDKIKTLKLNAQGKCKTYLPGQPIITTN